MSNQIAKMKKNCSSRVLGDTAKKMSKGTIDFSTMTITEALYVNIKSGIVKICDDPATSIMALPIAFQVDGTEENSNAFVKFLDSLDPKISNVVMDNVTDFKTMNIIEFRDKCKAKMQESPIVTSTEDTVTVVDTESPQLTDVAPEVKCGVDSTYQNCEIEIPSEIAESADKKASFYRP